MKNLNRLIPVFRNGKYYILQNGDIYSNARGKYKQLKPDKRKDGYLQIDLRDIHNKRMKFLIHQLVWASFNGNFHKFKEINHIDGNKLNNHISNLEMVTSKENNRHAVLMGLKPKGQNHSRSKLTEKQVFNIKRLLLKKISQNVIAKRYKVSQTCISKINTNIRWAHL